ncbi:MAG TPA: hypothetical protein VMC62_08095 [Longilinea sp.]|nr:hypothetical protein [Longilinea sp.]
MVRVRTICLIFLVLASGVTACSSNPRAALYGRWQMSNPDGSGPGNLIFEFESDGSLHLTISLANGQQVSQDLSYEFVDDSTIRFLPNSDSQAMVPKTDQTWRVEGDTLYLTSEDQTMELTRVK